jgi:hypothetical protein
MLQKKKKTLTTSNRSYEEFLRSLDLAAFGLNSTSSRLDRGLYMRLRRSPEQGMRKIIARYELSRFNDEFFDVLSQFSLTVEDKKTKQMALIIECSFGSHFHGKNPLDEQFAKRFADREHRFVVWPFIRQLVFDLTGRMAIPPVTIPLQED